MKLENLPIQYDEISEFRPDGLKISSEIIDPMLRISRDGQVFSATLFGVVRLRSGIRECAAISRAHNWILDGDTVRPLPRDVASCVTSIAKGIDLDRLQLADILSLMRSDPEEIKIEFSEAIFTSAKEQSKDLTITGGVPGLRADLFGYQASGVRWMHETLRLTGGLILADEMGLGKTIQIIAILLLAPPECDAPALIMCPTTLIANWLREFEKFAPSLSIMIHRGPRRTGVVQGLRQAQIILTTYDTALNDIMLISRMKWSWMICDEAQALKNPDSSRRKALDLISRARTIPMTGTPVENSLMDLWSLADLAVPGMLGNRSDFEARYSNDADSATSLARITGPIVLKRKVADVAGDLPERTDVNLPLELTENLASQYEDIRKSSLSEYSQSGALVATIRLQVFCAHPLLHFRDRGSKNWEEDVDLLQSSAMGIITPKIELTVELIREAFQNGRKVLVFSCFNKCAEIIKSALNLSADSYWNVINGSTPQEDRQIIVDEFSEFKGNACLLLNPRAAGSGLNITAATVVIHFTQVWNPAIEAQASARAHRRGQTSPVTIYRLYYKDTVEEVMIERAEWKRQLGNDAVPISTRDSRDLSAALDLSPRKTDD